LHAAADCRYAIRGHGGHETGLLQEILKSHPHKPFIIDDQDQYFIIGTRWIGHGA
jgi:hypothetical protein